jgi:hypothetical protein
MIHNAKWKTKGPRDSLADIIILHHDYLAAAYNAAEFMPPLPQYHEHIKKMATRDRDYRFQLEDALTALAKYKRKEDIPFIKEIMLEHIGLLGRRSFEILTSYPDTAYLEILSEFSLHRFYPIICRADNYDVATSFLNTLASYKADTCARLLSRILNRKPFLPCTFDTLYLRESLLRAIWDNPCPAFAALRTRIAPEMHRIRRRDSIWNLQLDTSYHPGVIIDTSAEPIRWW